jgi:hypothetical protein
MIIVNAANAPVRQRFTIAHEIGHFAPHRGTVHLDGRTRVNFRDGMSSMATDQEEIGRSGQRRLPGVLWAHGAVLLANRQPAEAGAALRRADRLIDNPGLGQHRRWRTAESRDPAPSARPSPRPQWTAG